MQTACRQAVQWPDGLRVASTSRLSSSAGPTSCRTVQDCLAQSGLEPGRLELEITESLIIEDLDRAIDTLRQLKAMGVRVAMDDFGTGYSSLATLQAFPSTISRSTARSRATSIPTRRPPLTYAWSSAWPRT